MKITYLEWQRIAQLLEVFVEDIHEDDFLSNNHEEIKKELQSLKEKIQILEQTLSFLKTTSTAGSLVPVKPSVESLGNCFPSKYFFLPILKVL